MKTVIYTQRVERIENYHETRDCADQNIPGFIQACGYLAVPISNVNTDITDLIKTLQPTGIILTGGNSLVKYGGNAPERDRTDKQLLDIALERDIPLWGFCRGMQSIIDYFGNALVKVEGHVAIRHIINVEGQEIEVNSYHNEGAVKVEKPLIVEGKSSDGVIESIRHENKPIYGTMWHPEREHPFRDWDISMLQNLFKL